MVKVLIDTDIGDDIDDALAISLAVLSPEIELIGVTTVYKNTKSRLSLARNLLNLLSANKVPVAQGIQNPLSNNVDTSEIPFQAMNLKTLYDSNYSGNAVDLIIESVKKYPDIIIVGIGPYTNIAVAMRLAPDIMKNAHIVLMGGAFSAVYPEWNVMCDVCAADILLNSGCKNLEMIGLDVTVKCVLTEEELRYIKLCKKPYQHFLSDLVDIWMDTSKGKKVTLHDPLTIAYLIFQQLLTMEKLPVVIEKEGKSAKYSTVVLKTPFRQRTKLPESNVNVAVDVDAEKVRQLIMSRIFNKME